MNDRSELLKHLKENLAYDKETGIFSTIGNKPGPRRKKCGCLDQEGYIQIGLDYKHYRAHHLAWLYVYEEWPTKFIDHIDGNRSNNAIGNLRLATQSENSQNRRKAMPTSKLGILGVRFQKLSKRNPYSAAITINGNYIHLGMFPTADLASKAYLDKKRELHPFSTI